jgi:hypothetical protein
MKKQGRPASAASSPTGHALLSSGCGHAVCAKRVLGFLLGVGSHAELGLASSQGVMLRKGGDIPLEARIPAGHEELTREAPSVVLAGCMDGH